MRKNEVVNYVKSKKLFEYKLSNFEVFIKDPLPDNVDIISSLKDIEKRLPESFLNLIDVMYVGDFSFFEKHLLQFFLILGIPTFLSSYP